MSKICIVGFTNPDLDGVACTVAYGECLEKTGVKTTPHILGHYREETAFLVRKFGLDLDKYAGQVSPDDKVILVDASEKHGLDENLKYDNVIELIDHRQKNDAEIFKNAKVQIELVGAAATLIFEKFRQKDLEISHLSAILLYGAIISNTLNFQAKVTTDRDRAAGAWLKENYKFNDDFAKEMFAAKSDLTGGKLKELMMGELAVYEMSGKRECIFQLEIIGGAELINHRLDEILAIMHEAQDNHQIDICLTSIVELEKNCNYLICDDELTKKLVSKALDIRFEGPVAKRNGLIMRKEIVPLLKEELEKILG